MLLPRILTALVLLALLVPALMAADPLPFMGLSLLLIAAGGWEWGRLNGLQGLPAVGGGLLVLLACVGLWQLGWTLQAPGWLWWLATGAWVLGGSMALKAGPAGWPTLSVPSRLILGWLVLTLAWLAFVMAKQRGLNFILSALCVVWMADVAAYAGGRMFGRRKLAPAISPGKSWEGVFSGVLGVMLLAAGWLSWEGSHPPSSPSVFHALSLHLGLLGLGLALVFLCALSVMGDLVESLAKRAVGAKDSSRLLPGHGGVLDRVDALLPTLPAVMALTSLVS